MSKAHLGYNANQASPPNPQQPTYIQLPKIEKYIPVAQQSQIAEAVKGHWLGYLTQQQSVMNLLINIVTENNWNNQTFQIAREIYLELLAVTINMLSKGALQPGSVNINDVNFQKTLALLALTQTPDIKNELGIITNSVDPNFTNNLRGMFGGIYETILVTRNQLNQNHQSQASTGFGFNQQGMGAQQPTLGMGNPTPMNQQHSGGSFFNNAQTAPQQQSVTLGGFNLPTTTTTTTTNTIEVAPKQPFTNVVEEPTPTVEGPKVVGGELICDEDHELYTQSVSKHRLTLGGWAVNTVESNHTSDEYSSVGEFKWKTIHGTVDKSFQLTPNSLNNSIIELEAMENGFSDEVDDYLDLDESFSVDDVNHPQFNGYLELLTEQDTLRRKLTPEIKLGVFTGGSGVCSYQTEPFGAGVSLIDAHKEILGNNFLDVIPEDAFEVILLGNREYILLNSESSVVNKLVSRRREDLNGYNNDNRSIKGHYYLINQYFDGTEHTCVVEDFYIMEKYMDAAKYQNQESESLDNKITNDEVESKDTIGISGIKLTTININDLGITPLGVAEYSRNAINASRVSSLTYNYASTIIKPTVVFGHSSKDKTFIKSLCKNLPELNTVKSLGDWLSNKSSNRSMSARLKTIIDARLMKVFNDLINYQLSANIVFEKSFVDEYEELLDILSSDGMLTDRAYATFIKMSPGIIKHALTLTPIEDLIGYKEFITNQTPYKLVKDELVISKGVGASKDVNVALDSVFAFLDNETIITVPDTSVELGLTLYTGDITVELDELNRGLSGIISSILLDNPYETVLLVTKDNYVLKAHGTDDILDKTIISLNM